MTEHRFNPLDYLNDGLIIADEQGHFVYTTGTGCARPLTDHPEALAEHLLFAGGIQLAQVLEEARAKGQWLGEAECLADPQHVSQYAVRFNHLRNHDGQGLGFLCLLRDISRERALERQVMLAQQMELVENLSGGIAHEFKNLLTVIMAYSSLLQDQMQGAPGAESAVKIMETAQQANDLTARLMAVTRPFKPRLENIDVQKVLDDVINMLQRSLPKRILFFAPEKRKLPRIYADANVLYRAILNVCMNAREAMPDGGELNLEADWVTVDESDPQVSPEQVPGSYIIISVTDTGCGIAPQIKERIFEPFFTTRHGGSGLGLSVVQHAIRNMGGWITVDSTEGHGSCFRLYIPAERRELASDNTPDQTPPAPGKETILAVDDDPLVLSITRHFLEKSGYQALTACGGEEALRIFKENAGQIDLVLLDVVMPHVSGEDVFREILRLKPAIKVVVVSGFAQQTAARILKGSQAAFLPKPFSHGQLTRTIRDMIDGKKQEDQNA